ncbi:hypothetical protein CH376_23605 [Leptospira adleri]|uniref:Uncharacterized protein n=1 Tax=Leptospira adleri TaxID=2023186 RepID=A0ABX4NV25_9LEPT|nr:hypothetical protein CH376_23605 [Leptospira adleri]
MTNAAANVSYALFREPRKAINCALSLKAKPRAILFSPISPKLKLKRSGMAHNDPGFSTFAVLERAKRAEELERGLSEP